MPSKPLTTPRPWVGQDEINMSTSSSPAPRGPLWAPRWGEGTRARGPTSSPLAQHSEMKRARWGGEAAGILKNIMGQDRLSSLRRNKCKGHHRRFMLHPSSSHCSCCLPFLGCNLSTQKYMQDAYKYSPTQSTHHFFALTSPRSRNVQLPVYIHWRLLASYTVLLLSSSDKLSSK